MLLFCIITLMIIAFPVIYTVKLLLLPFARPIAKLKHRIFSADIPLVEIFLVLLDLIRYALITISVIILAYVVWDFFDERKLRKMEKAETEQGIVNLAPTRRETQSLHFFEIS